MPDDVIVVEAKATVGMRTKGGVPTQESGVFAVDRELIAPALAALPERMLRVLSRPPTEEEIHRSAQRGLVFGISLKIPLGGPGREPPAPEADQRPLGQLRRDDLVSSADRLRLDASGTRAQLIERIEMIAERHGVSTEGPGLAVVQRIFEALS